MQVKIHKNVHAHIVREAKIENAIRKGILKLKGPTETLELLFLGVYRCCIGEVELKTPWPHRTGAAEIQKKKVTRQRTI
jgi:hypothetical protein